MSATVVMARSYDDARRAAALLGLGHSWLYPHRAELLHGVTIDRVVYVQGWFAHGEGVPAEVIELLPSRLGLNPAARIDLVDLEQPGGIPVELSAPAPRPMGDEPHEVVDSRESIWRDRNAWGYLAVAVVAVVCILGVWLGW